VGTYFLLRWRLFLSLVAGVGAVYALCRYTPSAFPTLLLGLGELFLCTLPAYFEQVQVQQNLHHFYMYIQGNYLM
jgi:hypothetical protein